MLPEDGSYCVYLLHVYVHILLGVYCIYIMLEQIVCWVNKKKQAHINSSPYWHAAQYPEL